MMPTNYLLRLDVRCIVILFVVVVVVCCTLLSWFVCASLLVPVEDHGMPSYGLDSQLQCHSQDLHIGFFVVKMELKNILEVYMLPHRMYFTKLDDIVNYWHLFGGELVIALFKTLALKLKDVEKDQTEVNIIFRIEHLYGNTH